MGSNTDPIPIGIPLSEAKNIHLEGLYNIQNKIAAIIEFGGTTGQRVNYDAIKALVELAISTIPDIDQGNKCRELMEKKEQESLKLIAQKRNHNTPTTDDEQDAIRESAFAMFNLIHVIYDDDIGIRKQYMIGVA